MCLQEAAKGGAHTAAAEEDGWEEVGPRNQTARVNTTSFTQSPITAIFGGQIRSTVLARGTKTASVTMQPFHSLQLDIQACPWSCLASHTVNKAVAFTHDTDFGLQHATLDAARGRG